MGASGAVTAGAGLGAACGAIAIGAEAGHGWLLDAGAIPRAPESARTASVAVEKRWPGSGAVMRPNQASNAGGRYMPLRAARAQAGSTGPRIATFAIAKMLPPRASSAQYGLPTSSVNATMPSA